MDYSWPAWFSVIIVIGLVIDAVGGYLSGRAARSKGYSFGLFFGLSFVSWFVVATIAVFIKPRTGISEIDPARKSLSWILYFTGLGAFVLGPFTVAIAAAIYAPLNVGMMSQVVNWGAIGLTFMGIGLILAAVGLAKNHEGQALQEFQASIN